VARPPEGLSFTRAVVGAIFALAMLASACGTDDSSPTGAPAAAPSPSTSSEATSTTTSPSTTATTAPRAHAAGLPPGLDGPYRVVRVVDGDTVEVSKGETLRLIGMDTPETVDPREPVQCFGREASARAHELLDGTSVYLEYDATQGVLDRYGRTLAYVWLADGRLFNRLMIAGGYAHEYTYDVPYRYQAEFQAAERSAREHDRGLWAPDTCAGDTTTPADGAPTTDGGAVGGCDVSYPDVCVPPPPPDLDCGDIAFSRFRVVGADPHRFDGDRDGVGCEG
jgi:micrococcal nuclease